MTLRMEAKGQPPFTIEADGTPQECAEFLTLWLKKLPKESFPETNPLST